MFSLWYWITSLARKNNLSNDFCSFIKNANTARQIFESDFKEKDIFIKEVGKQALIQAKAFAGHNINVEIYSFGYSDKTVKKYQVSDIN